MPRGPQPQDARLFAPERLHVMRNACDELAWLLSRGYVLNSSLKLVGDRHELVGRQREALTRCVCSDEQRDIRLAARVDAEALRGKRVAIDGFNLIIIVESAMAGGVLLRGRDSALRDLASVHGSYRRAEHTHAAIEAIAGSLDELELAGVTWYLDQPVSNSGRLAGWLREVGAAPGREWQVELVPNPDKVLVAGELPVISSDGWVIEKSPAWTDLATRVVEGSVANPWYFDLFST